MNRTIFLFIAMVTCTISCIKDEEADTNADILEAYIPEEYLKTEPIITNNSVEFRVKSNVDLESQSPQFVVSPFATINPPNGTILDYTNPQKVTVTAQDPRWKKEYIISFVSDELSTKYTFNKAELVDKNRYYRFYEIGNNGSKIYDWDSGNQGYSTIVDAAYSPNLYPTTITSGRKGGQAVKMQTVYTASFAAATGNPIAAGNLFIGQFKLNIFNTLKSTRFGLPYSGGLPKKLRGFYKYTPGKTVTDKSFNEVAGAVDSFDIYAILFEPRQKDNYLTGDHNFNDPRNIAIARLSPNEKVNAVSWTEFETKFRLVNGKSFDPKKDYMLTIVMTSSIDGGDFKGAIGSTLIVDEVELVY